MNLIHKMINMSKKRETIELSREVLTNIIDNSRYRPTIHNGIEYKLYENIITGSDIEDGGADHTMVFERLTDNKYFKYYYTDWEMQRADEQEIETVDEVFAIKKTILIFK